MLVPSVLPPQVHVHRELVRRGGLYEFTRLAFKELEPRAFVDNWHIGAMAEHLQAVSRADIRNLIINIPPGTMKSLMVSVLWPAWTWIDDPAFKFIYAAYTKNLSRRDAIRARSLINSDWFQQRWGFGSDPSTGRPSFDDPRFGDKSIAIPWQNTRSATYYVNNHKGFRFSTSVGGEATGNHGDALVIDDPNKAAAASGGRAATGVELQDAIDFWTGTMSTRQADPSKTRKVIIMQRLHENDLAGHEAASGDYQVLCLPMNCDARRRCITSIGFVDPRADGELLWPARFKADDVANLRRAMGTVAAAAQLDQNPIPDGGAIFNPDWLLQEWRVVPGKAQLYMSVDCAFKDLKSSDFVAIQIWGKLGSQFYLVDQVCERLSFPATLQAIRDMKAKYPKVTGIYVEDKANGTAVLATLKKEIPGMKPINPEGGKEARANAVAPYFEAGDVYLPPVSICPWVADYREEMRKFPRGKNDDQVDATTQILLKLAGSSGDRMKKAMDAMKAA